MIPLVGRRVPGKGPLNPKIVIIGEAPGREEEVSGEPFVGSSGRLLNQLLSVAGIDRSQCYLTNVAKQRPPENEFSVFYNDYVPGKECKRNDPSDELRRLWADLKAEVSYLKPNLVICLGGEALRAITGRRSIDRWRGSILSTEVGKVIGTYHPAYVLRSYLSRPIVELDLRRCREQSLFPDVRTPKMEFIIDPSFEQAMGELKRLQSSKRVAVDIETTDGGFTRCIGLSDRKGWAICIPLMSAPRPSKGSSFISLNVQTSGQMNSHWSEEQEHALLSELNILLKSPSVEKSGQNLPFDSTNLGIEFGIDLWPITMDTMLGWHACYSELPKALDFLVSVCTEIPYYSDYDPSSDLETWRYNCFDAAGTFEVDEKIRQDLRDLGIEEFFTNQVLPSMVAYTRAQNRGVLVDTTERDRQRPLIEAEIERLNKIIQHHVGESRKARGVEVGEFNPSSPKQMAKLLYDEWGLKPEFHKKTKKPTADKVAMESLARKHPEKKEFFDAVREHGSNETILSGFYKVQLGSNNRIYTSYNVAGTDTGRLSSSSSPIYSASTNLQNRKRPEQYPKGHPQAGQWKLNCIERRAFIADPGWGIIKADLSQAEFREVVWYAKIERLIQKYQTNPDFDVHTWVASLIFRKPENEVSKEERSTAKNGVYGGNYDMHYQTASKTYKIPLHEAKFVLDEYHKAIPEIPLWWREVQHAVNTTRRLVNPLGRSRFFFDRLDQELYRAAYAHLPQSLVGDIINHTAILVDEVFPEDECHILLQVHDELVLQARLEVLAVYALRLKKLMEYPVLFPGVSIPLIIPADVATGPNWLDVKKICDKCGHPRGKEHKCVTTQGFNTPLPTVSSSVSSQLSTSSC